MSLDIRIPEQGEHVARESHLGNEAQRDQMKTEGHYKRAMHGKGNAGRTAREQCIARAVSVIKDGRRTENH